MNHFQFYLMKLAEECSEIAQQAMKIMQFGRHAHDSVSRTTYDNIEMLHNELDDLQAMIEELNERFSLNYTPNRARIMIKRDKVRKYLGYSIDAGNVTPE